MINFKIILLWLLLLESLFGAKVTIKEWKEGELFSNYLKAQNIPLALMKTIEEDDRKYLTEIEAHQPYYELTNSHGVIEQVLIPLGEEMQIMIAKEHHKERYIFDIIPISYNEKEYSATVSIQTNLSSDVGKTLNLMPLGTKIGQLCKGTVDAKKFKKGDSASFFYTQKTRMGQPYMMPNVKMAMIKSQGKKQFIYVDEEGYGYTSATKSQAYTITGKKKVTFSRQVSSRSSGSFRLPLRHARISSSFSYRRFHPILKRYRPHHGTDFGARKGTPLLAVNNGVITYASRMGSYGKVVKIRHTGGYESLYAHQSRIRVKRGQKVKKGQIIGYVGSTGRSTGPHLHFGLMKRGRWIDPMRVLGKGSQRQSITERITQYKEVKTLKYKKVVIKNASINKAKLLKYIKAKPTSFVWENYKENSMKVEEYAKYHQKL